MKKLFSLLVVGVLTSAPSFAHAAVSLPNPLGITDVRDIMGRIISAALSISGSIALLMFVYGGILWLTSRGESKQVEKGKAILVWSTLGLGVIFSSYVLVSAIISALTTGSV